MAGGLCHMLAKVSLSQHLACMDGVWQTAASDSSLRAFISQVVLPLVAFKPSLPLFCSYNTVCCCCVSGGFHWDVSLSVDMCVRSLTYGIWTSVSHNLHAEFRASASHASGRSFWQIDTLLFLPESQRVPSLPMYFRLNPLIFYLWINFNLLSIIFL